MHNYFIWYLMSKLGMPLWISFSMESPNRMRMTLWPITQIFCHCSIKQPSRRTTAYSRASVSLLPPLPDNIEDLVIPQDSEFRKTLAGQPFLLFQESYAIAAVSYTLLVFGSLAFLSQLCSNTTISMKSYRLMWLFEVFEEEVI